MGRLRSWSPIVVFALVVSACAGGDAEVVSPPTSPAASEAVSPPSPDEEASETAAPRGCAAPGTFATGCPVPGYPDRPFDLAVPEGAGPFPVMVVLHGGAGDSTNAVTNACTEPTAPNCWPNLARSEGFLAVFPNGTGSPRRPESRTWNAGGGGPDYACASGYACRARVDDIAYLNAVLDEVEATYDVDTDRIYVTGFSNGAAMAHRVGCELSGRVAAIAPVSGGNQYAAVAPCEPERPVPVLYAHGTEDPCWAYEQSARACLEPDPRPKVGARETILGWVARNGCPPEPEVSELADRADDGMTTTAEVWADCEGGVAVELLTIEGGGHVFPSGSAAVPRVVGDATFDWGSEVLWDFLSRFTLEG